MSDSVREATRSFRRVLAARPVGIRTFLMIRFL